MFTHQSQDQDKADDGRANDSNGHLGKLSHRGLVAIMSLGLLDGLLVEAVRSHLDASLSEVVQDLTVHDAGRWGFEFR